MSSPVKIWREAKNRYQYLDKTGKIVSLTKIQTPVTGFSAWVPYWVAVIELENGKMITAQLILGAKRPQVGQRVVGVLRRLKKPEPEAVVEYGVKWKVIEK